MTKISQQKAASSNLTFRAGKIVNFEALRSIEHAVLLKSTCQFPLVYSSGLGRRKGLWKDVQISHSIEE
jgi:hypothetical protein